MLTLANVLPAGAAKIRFHHWPTNRGWLRDSGPIFVRDLLGGGGLVALNWRFNGWAKYRELAMDDALPQRIAEATGAPRMRPDCGRSAESKRRMVLEGGSIDVNGRGACSPPRSACSARCSIVIPAWHAKRWKPPSGRSSACSKVMWLERGIAGDDTHGHVDDIARFVAPRTVLAAGNPTRRMQTTHPCARTCGA